MEKKLPKCRNCKERFTPFYNNALQPYCMKKDECIKAHVDKQKADNEKRMNIRAKNKRKDHPETYYKENKAQLLQLVQHIARLIDKDVHCIDCDRTEAHRWDGGHFVSKGSNKAISLNLHNIFKQNGWCNNQGQTSNEAFLIGVKKMYGNEYGEYVDSLTALFPYIGLKAPDYPQKITEALKIVRELKSKDETYTPKQRIKLRTKYNKRIGIYLDND